VAREGLAGTGGREPAPLAAVKARIRALPPLPARAPAAGAPAKTPAPTKAPGPTPSR